MLLLLFFVCCGCCCWVGDSNRWVCISIDVGNVVRVGAVGGEDESFWGGAAMNQMEWGKGEGRMMGKGY